MHNVELTCSQLLKSGMEIPGLVGDEQMFSTMQNFLATFFKRFETE